MPEWIKILLNMVAQFTGGRGGIDHVIVNYAIAGFFWGMLLIFARARQRQSPAPREALLLWGFGFALARELFMMFMALMQALKFVDPVALHVIFPPLEHELHDLALVVIGAAYLRFLLDDVKLTQRYIFIGLGITVVCYLSTCWWWADYIRSNPTSKFGQVWPDWVFHINRSIWALVPAVILWRRTKGWLCKAIVTAFTFFFIHAVLKLPDMALDEVYENVFTPIARSFYLTGIPIFAYVYIREQWNERNKAEAALQAAHADLENQVAQRTKELELALSQVKSEIVKKDEIAAELEAFAYSVAHDLKSPLRAMGGFSQALLEDYGKVLDQTAHGYLNRITRSATRMDSLIDDLLRYSRLGCDELKFEPVPIAEVLAQVKANLKTDIEAAGGRIDVRGELPVLEGHRLTLELIFQNLMNNAIKFMPPERKPAIVLSAADDNGDCIFSLHDNGIGIDPEYQTQIFKIFQRLHSGESYSGTGIGLAIVKKGVMLHHGSIWVDSQVGVGSTFSLRLPYRQSG